MIAFRRSLVGLICACCWTADRAAAAGAAATAAAAAAFRPSNAAANNSGKTKKAATAAAAAGGIDAALSVRGGELGVDPSVAGKIFTGMWLGQGAAFSLTPKLMAKIYGLRSDPDDDGGGKGGTSSGFGVGKDFYSSSSDLTTEFIVENMGGAALATGIAAYCMQVISGSGNAAEKVMSANRALGWVGFSWMLHHIKWYLANSYGNVGFKLMNAALTNVTSLLTMYCGFAEPTWAKTWFMISIALYGLAAMQGIFAPEMSLDFWGCKSIGAGAGKGKVKFALKAFMYHLLASQVHAFCLIEGVDPRRAIAFASCSILVFFLDSFFLSKEIPTLIKEKSTGYGFWLPVFSFLIYAILGDDGIPATIGPKA